MLFEVLNSDPVETEPVTRYLFEKGHFAATKGTVNPRGLEPARRDGRTSVFRTIDLTEDQIWRLGQIYVVPDRGLPILARADFKVSDIYESGLRIVPDEPPPRHANITGWPPVATTEKSIIMSKAQELAARANLEVIPAQAHS